jgi:1,4-dihydroxy-2-naphthoyl-CoA synthase
VLNAMREESEVFGRLLKEAPAIEAFNAFLEKRKPDFSKV